MAGTVPHNGLSARFRQTDHQHLAGYHAHYLCAYPGLPNARTPLPIRSVFWCKTSRWLITVLRNLPPIIWKESNRKRRTHTDAIMRRGGSKDLSLCQGHCLQTKKSPSCEGLGLFAEDFFIQAFQFVDIMRNQPQPFIPESRVIRIQSERFEQFIIIGYGRF